MRGGWVGFGVRWLGGIWCAEVGWDLVCGVWVGFGLSSKPQHTQVVKVGYDSPFATHQPLEAEIVRL